MLPLVLLLLAQPVSDSRVTRVERVPGGRMEGGRGGVKAWAFFEAFPASGAGTTTACSTTPPTGAKGEVLTFARTGNATCTKTASGGLATTGIADGDLSEMTANQPRVEYDSGGVKGLRVESSRINSLFRFIEFGNVLWSDVGTPTLTGSQASPFAGTYATSAVLFDDNDGAAFEGRSQVVTVSAAAAHYAHCYVKAGTATSARISLDGTAATITGLSGTTWSIVEVADASASAGTVIFEVDVGSTTAATGTVTFGGCQVEAGAYRTSIIPTTSAAVTRNVESADFIVSISPTASTGLSTAATITTASTATWTSGGGWLAPVLTSGSAGTALNGALYWWTYTNTGPSAAQDSAGVVSAGLSGYVPGFATLNATSNRVSASHSGSAWTLCQNGSCATSGASTLGTPAFTRVMLGNPTGAAANQNDKIVSRACVELNSTRCR